MIRCFLLFSLFLLVVSCGGEEKAIKTTLDKIKNYDDAQTVIDLLDKESIKYFTEMAKAAVGNDEMKIRNFCDFYPYPLASRYLLQTLALASSDDEPATPVDLKDVILIATLADFGPIGLENRKKTRFHEISESSDYEVTAVLNYKAAKNTYVQSKVIFHKEDDVWKINYPSTVSYFEKYLKKLYSQTGGSDRDFIQGVIANGGKEVKMRYRK